MAVLHDHDAPLCELPGPGASLTPEQWQAEIVRRAAEVVAGSAELEDAEVVHGQIAARLRSLHG